MFNAVCGATVSKSEDIQQAIMPLSMIAMVSFYFAYMTSMAPESPAAVAASLVPFSAPFSMPSRMLSANIPAWQIVLSLLILAGTTVLMCFISIKLYSSAVLHYGKRLKISELIRMSKAK
jgi:ABC-2 type transport system permease protein